ncbi:MAG: hypothetical protein U9Q67_04085 [Patescibacteria group bacterium]|nr:hypothetical protein [Patescibacteria group bacterium]
MRSVYIEATIQIALSTLLRAQEGNGIAIKSIANILREKSRLTAYRPETGITPEVEITIIRLVAEMLGYLC